MTFAEEFLADCKESLADKKNAYNAYNGKQSCCNCKHNLMYMIHQLVKNPEDAVSLFTKTEEYILKKKCAHVWHMARSMEASWDVLPHA